MITVRDDGKKRRKDSMRKAYKEASEIWLNESMAPHDISINVEKGYRSREGSQY